MGICKCLLNRLEHSREKACSRTLEFCMHALWCRVYTNSVPAEHVHKFCIPRRFSRPMKGGTFSHDSKVTSLAISRLYSGLSHFPSFFDSARSKRYLPHALHFSQAILSTITYSPLHRLHRFPCVPTTVQYAELKLHCLPSPCGESTEYS